MFPIDMNSGERQRMETQIIHCSCSIVAMLQTIGSSDCIYESYLKKPTLLQKDRFHQMPHSNKGLSENLCSKGAMAFAHINNTQKHLRK